MSHMKKTQLYITRVNMMRKLPLSRVVVTKQKRRFKGPPSASEWAFQGLEAARKDDVGSVAR